MPRWWAVPTTILDLKAGSAATASFAVSRPSSVPHLDRRRTALAALLGAGVLVLLLVVSRSDSLGTWLLWRYLRAALLAGVFGLACLVAGHALVLRAVGQLPLAEHVALALPVGVLAFFLLSF